VSARKKAATTKAKAASKAKTRPKASAKGAYTFEAKVAPEGENFVVEVPFDVREAFGKARPPILVTVDGYTFPSTIAVYGGKSFIGVRKSHRAAAGIVPGQTVSIAIALDTSERKVTPPDDLARALARNAAAKKAWAALSFSHQREHVEALLEAKKPETRARRLEKTLAMLLDR
jgi:hypothetical protein